MKIKMFSPSASDPEGHPIYAREITKYLCKHHDITLFTLPHTDLNSALKRDNLTLQLSQIYLPGFNKGKFIKYRVLNKLVYGIARMIYNYRLIQEFYADKTHYDLYHLLEFEYLAIVFYFFFHKHNLRSTVLGFHSADFRWIKGRSIQVNLYKVIVKLIFPNIIKHSAAVTVNGHVLRDNFIHQFRIENYSNKVFITGWGSTRKNSQLSKAEARKKLNLDGNVVYALFFGLLRRNKGIVELIENFYKTRNDVNLIIAGKSLDITDSLINEKIMTNGKNRIIPFIRYITEEEIEWFYRAADFIIIPHKSEFYSFSGPLSLSVENHRPVVSSNVGELGFFVNKFNLGYTFESGNWDDMVDKINLMQTEVTNNVIGQKYNFIGALDYNSWESVSARINDTYKFSFFNSKKFHYEEN